MRKSRLFSLMCALVPGAGAMYLGLMKRGASQMLLFSAVILCSVMVAPLLVFLPVIWFYSFFETLNLRNMTVEQIQSLVAQDDFLFSHLTSQPSLGRLRGLLQRGHLLVGWALVGIGVYSLYDRLRWYLWSFIRENSHPILLALIRLMDSAPTFLVSLLLIWVGVRFIRGKKVRFTEEEEVPPYRGEAPHGPEKEEQV